MPNHVHLLLHYTNPKQSLNTIIGNGKRFIGYSIIERLKEKGETAFITQMKDAERAKDRQRNKLHEVWKGTFDVKECRTGKFILQKLNSFITTRAAVNGIYVTSLMNIYIVQQSFTMEIRQAKK